LFPLMPSLELRCLALMLFTSAFIWLAFVTCVV
jgi:hypothetical protein